MACSVAGLMGENTEKRDSDPSSDMDVLEVALASGSTTVCSGTSKGQGLGETVGEGELLQLPVLPGWATRLQLPRLLCYGGPAPMEAPCTDETPLLFLLLPCATDMGKQLPPPSSPLLSSHHTQFWHAGLTGWPGQSSPSSSPSCPAAGAASHLAPVNVFPGATHYMRLASHGGATPAINSPSDVTPAPRSHVGRTFVSRAIGE